MGPVREASPKAGAYNALLPLALRAFPSPALSNGSLDSPTLQKTLASVTSPAPWTPYSVFPEASSIMPSEPGASKEALVVTPPAEQSGTSQSSLGTEMNIIVGGALVPISDVAPQRLVAKTGPGLRLPSFEAMGIASPRPDNLCQRVADSTVAGAARERALGLALRSHSDPGRVEASAFHTTDVGSLPEIEHIPSPKPCSHPQQTPLHQYVHTLTPPAETGEPGWRPSIMTAAMDSPDMESGLVPSGAEEGDQSVKAASGAMQNVSISSPIITGERSWLEEAVQTVRKLPLLPGDDCSTTNKYHSLQPQDLINTKPTPEDPIACTPKPIAFRSRVYKHY